MKKKYYPAIDIMKLVCSILVIAVHTNPLRPQFPFGNFILINVFGRIIVPFFFISTSFFFAQQLYKKGDGYFKPYIMKLIKMYLIWFIIYIPFGLYRLPEMIQMEITPLIWVGVIVEGLLFHGSYFHLWYIAALIVGITLVYFLQKKISFKWIFVISSILFLFGLSETYIDVVKHIPIFNSITDFYFQWFITTRNGVFFGMMFISLGFELAKEKPMIKIKRPGMLSIIFFALLLIEAVLLREFSEPLNYNMLLMQIPFTVCFFEYLKTIQFKQYKVPKSFSEYNTKFYLTHAMFLELIPLALIPLHATVLWDQGWFRFFSVLLCTYVLSTVLIRINEYRAVKKQKIKESL